MAYEENITRPIILPLCGNMTTTPANRLLTWFYIRRMTNLLLSVIYRFTLRLRYNRPVKKSSISRICRQSYCCVFFLLLAAPLANAQIITLCPGNINQNTDPGLCTAVVSYNVTYVFGATITHQYAGATNTGILPGTGSPGVFNKGITTVTIWLSLDS